MFVPAAKAAPAVIPSAKAEMIGRVEDVFLHNYRDITWRKSLAWGEVQTAADGARSITYSYEAKIWDKETMVMKQTFTFAADGKFVRSENETGYPKKKDAPVADVTTQKGMIALVEDFFSKNFRDITARETIAWGQVAKDAKGNSTIRYKYNATIWDKEKKVMEQDFTFDPSGKFVSANKVEAAKR
jgi:hypothetical protein